MPSSGGKVRSSANAPDSSGVSTNEKILRDCHSLYIDETKGLISIADSVGISLLAPRKKITVMLMGNHSAGKSSFINWYIEEHVQKTGVAIETQGFTVVTSGKKKESLTGNATFHLYQHLKPLQDISGVGEYVTTEISTSKQKRFNLVMFVDTPGLVDGDMLYPFDVNTSIEWLGGLCDLIFVFFDPIGQALCKRTLNIVEILNEKNSDKLRFYLTKADTAGTESDRQRVLMQITQELCKRPGLNKCGFDMPTIFVPSLVDKPPRCENQIESLCRTIEKTITQTIQNTLNTLEKDCGEIADRIDAVLLSDSKTWGKNFRQRIVSFMFGSFGMLLLMFLAISQLAKRPELNVLELAPYLESVDLVWSNVPYDYVWHTTVALLVSSLLAVIISRVFWRTKQTLSRKQRRLLEEKKNYVQTHVKPQKEKLYSEYLQQSVAEHDL